MTKNNFGLPESRWSQMEEPTREQFNRTYTEVQNRRTEIINELPKESRPKADDKSLEQYTKLVVAETVRAGQLHSI